MSFSSGSQPSACGWLSAKRVCSCFRDSLAPRGLVIHTACDSLNRGVAMSQWLLTTQVNRKAALRAKTEKRAFISFLSLYVVLGVRT